MRARKVEPPVVGIALALLALALLAFSASPALALPSGTGASGHALPQGATPNLAIQAGALPSLVGAKWNGALAANTEVAGGLSFPSQNAAAQQQLLNQIYTPGSPQYHHFLVGNQFDAAFAPDASLQASLLSYFEMHDIQVTQTSPYLWNLVGTAGNMGAAFGTTFSQGELSGRSGFGPAQPLALPSAFAPLGASVSGGFQTLVPPVPVDLLRAPHFEVAPSPSTVPSIGSAALVINITSPYIIQYHPANTAIAFPPTNLNTTWTLSLSGGTPPYKVSWHWFDGTIQNFVTSATSLANFHSYYEPGQSDYCDVVVCGNVTVFVNDSAGGSSSYDVGLVPGVSPATDQLYYDASTLARMGMSGQGTKIGLDELCDPGYSSYQSDLATYSTDMGLPAPTVQLIGTGASSCIGGSSGWSGETLLDMEAVHAMAPNATIVVDLADSTIQEGDCTWNTLSNGVYLASNSWGGGTVANTCWTKAASQGESYQSSSGDCGAFTAGSRDEPADFPTGVGVGGTDVYPQPSGIFLREFAWNGTFQSSCGNNEGSTGGYSSVAAPYYQTGMTGFSGTNRGVPDVSAIGGTWFWMIYTGGVTLSAGTSLACPTYTAMLDLMWQYNSSTPKPQGMANYNLYTIAKGANYDVAMHDVVVGNNIHGTAPPGFGYTTTVGWDPVTGLGSADVGKLAMFLASQNGNTGAFGALTAFLAANVTFGNTSLAVDFGADVTGGSSPLTGYSYAWNFGDGGTATTSLAWTTHTYTTPGIYWPTVTVTQGANSGSSNSVMIHVRGATGGSTGGPSVGSITASPSSADTGQSVTFTPSVSGGTTPYTYSWSTAPATGLGCGSLTGATLTCTPTASSVYTVSLKVTDKNGNSGTGSAPAYTVYPTPTVGVPAPSTTAPVVGTAFTFTATAGLSGSGSDVYSWTQSASGLGCTSANALSISCTPTTAGTYTVTAKVTDSNGGVGSNTSASLTVSGGAGSGPSVTAPVGSPTSVDVGQTVSFTTVASGGTAPYTYAWSSTPSAGLGCSNSATSTWTCVPTAAGTYTVGVTVTDSASKTGSSSATYVVSADPSITTPVASVGGVDVGGTVTFSSTVSSIGSGGDVLLWTISPGTGLGCPNTASTSITCVPVTAGTYTATFKLTDSNGFSVSSPSAPFTVSPDPSLSTPAPSPSSVQVGGTVTFTTTVTNPGAGSDQLTWSASTALFGCSTSTTTSYSCTPTAAGTGYTVTVVLTDANGVTARGTSAPFTVSPTSGALAATASCSPASGPAPLSVQCTGSGSGGAPPYTYAWTFGDGGTGTGSVASHTYTRSGTFTATVVVTDSASSTASGKATVSVQSAGALSVNLAPSPNPANVGQAVSFTSTIVGGRARTSTAGTSVTVG